MAVVGKQKNTQKNTMQECDMAVVGKQRNIEIIQWRLSALVADSAPTPYRIRWRGVMLDMKNRTHTMGLFREITESYFEGYSLAYINSPTSR